jgi:hypothetical protein
MQDFNIWYWHIILEDALYVVTGWLLLVHYFLAVLMASNSIFRETRLPYAAPWPVGCSLAYQL